VVVEKTANGLLTARYWDLERGNLKSTGVGNLSAFGHSSPWGDTEVRSDKVPTLSNHSGLYSCCLDERMESGPGCSGRILGAVECRGRIQVHSDGVVRSEWCRILALFVDSKVYTKAQARKLHQKYKVPVTYTDAPEWSLDAYIDNGLYPPGVLPLKLPNDHKPLNSRNDGAIQVVRYHSGRQKDADKKAHRLQKWLTVACVIFAALSVAHFGSRIYAMTKHYSGTVATVQSQGAAHLIASVVDSEITGDGSVSITRVPGSATYVTVYGHMIKGDWRHLFAAPPTKYQVEVDVNQGGFIYGDALPMWCAVVGWVLLVLASWFWTSLAVTVIDSDICYAWLKDKAVPVVFVSTSRGQKQ
jgi:hypothetical protein